MAVKGKRSYDDMEADELVNLLEDRDDQVEKLKKKVALLTRQLKDANEDAADEQGGLAGPDYQQQAEKWRKSIKSAITNQMAYKKGHKHSTSRAVHEIPNLPMPAVEAILGANLLAKASKGPKQIAVQADNNELYELLGGHISKSLRYGSCLQLVDGLKFVYNKAEKVLRITGNYKI